MMKKILLACMIIFAGTVSAIGEEYSDRAYILSGDVRFLTGYDVNLTITAANFDINACSEYISNRIRVPVQANIDGGSLSWCDSGISGVFECICGDDAGDFCGGEEICSELI